ncbi:protein disulfide oxidoreductase [Neisseria sp. CCUG12390]|uniref:protein disulfide oxidoreductase n=1 Tax=Neisseria sp. CCUG12390 TaxID=3392035 RepID=UPI003A0FDD81
MQIKYAHILSYLKSFLQALLIFTVISFSIDWLRKPSQPSTLSSQALTTLTQDKVRLTQFSQDRIGIVYFWGTWCGICKYTSPTIEKLHQNHIPVISIALTSGNNTSLQTYLTNRDFTFPTVNDSDGLISNHWDISVTPTIVLIKNGRMIHSTTGISSYWGIRLRMFAMNLLY